MGNTISISPELLQRLQHRAEVTGLSIDDLLCHWLAVPEEVADPGSIPYAQLLEKTTELVVLFDRVGRILYVNTSAAQVMRQPPTALIGKMLSQLGISEKQLQSWEKIHHAVLQSGREHVITFTIMDGDTPHHYEGRLQPIFDDAGAVQYVLENIYDVTARIRAEETLREERALFISGPAVMFQWENEPGWPVRYVSPNFFEQYGYETNDFIEKGMPFAALIHAEDVQQVLETVDQAVAQNLPHYTIEYRIRHANGQYRWVREFTVAVRDARGRIKYHQGHLYDITMQKEAQLRLESQHTELDRFFETAQDLMCISSLDGRFLRVNRKWEEVVGLAVEDLEGSRFLDLVHPDDYEITVQALQSLREGHSVESFVNRYRDRQGNYRHIEWSSHSFGGVAYASARDITTRIEMEARLRESEERYRILADMLYDFALLFHIKPDGTAELEWSTGEKMLEIYGPGDISTQQLKEATHPDDWPQVIRDATHTVNHNVQTTTEYRVRKQNNEYIWLRVTRQPVWDEKEGRVVRYYSAGRDITEHKRLEETIRKSEERLRGLISAVPDLMFRQSVDGTYLDYHAPSNSMLFVSPEKFMGRSMEEVLPESMAGRFKELFRRVIRSHKAAEVEYGMEVDGEKRYFEARMAPIGADEVVTMVRDITRRKQAEMYALERERLTANLKKEQEINALIQHAVATLSHDVRTPLAVIASTKDILNRYYDQLSDASRLQKLNTIEKQLHFVVEMLDDLTLVVKGSLDHRVFQPRPINLEALCQISMDEVRLTSGSAHRLVFDVKGRVGPVLADETLVSRILLNLLSNAVKYSPPGTEVRLQLYRQDAEIIIRVIDHGIGISEADLQHIFKPFYRVPNAQAAGTGLGLSIVHDCVQRHLGTIEVESELGRGTSFTIHLPTISME